MKKNRGMGQFLAIIICVVVCGGMMLLSGLSIWIGKGHKAKKAERARIMDEKAYGHLDKQPFVAQKRGYQVKY